MGSIDDKDEEDEKEHSDFDNRYLNISRPSCLPTTARRKLTNGFRTAYTTMICIIISSNWNIGGYLAPCVSTISASSAFFGQWQSDAWKVTYSGIFGGALGICIGYTWEIVPLQVFLVFFGMIWLNKCSLWDRLAKVLGCLAMVTGALWPSISDGVMIGSYAFRMILSFIIIPYLITGAVLLFPFRWLAIYTLKSKSSDICSKLTASIVAVIRAFCALGFVDLYGSEISNLVSEIEVMHIELGALRNYVVNESILFPNLGTVPAALDRLIHVTKRVVVEINGLRELLPQIYNNKTQAKFVEDVKPYLEELGADLEASFSIIAEHINAYEPIPLPWLSFLHEGMLLKFMRRFSDTGGDGDHSDEEAQNQDQSTRKKDATKSERTTYFQRRQESPTELGLRQRSGSWGSQSAPPHPHWGSQSAPSHAAPHAIRSLNGDDSDSIDLESGTAFGSTGAAHLNHSHTGPAGSGAAAAALDSSHPGNTEEDGRAARREEFQQRLRGLKKSRERILRSYKEVRAKYVWIDRGDRADAHDGDDGFGDGVSEGAMGDTANACSDGRDGRDLSHSSSWKEIQRETQMTSWRNLFPRGAFLHRLLVLTDHVGGLYEVLEEHKSMRPTMKELVVTNLTIIWKYVWEIGMMWADVLWFIVRISYAIVTYPWRHRGDIWDTATTAQLITSNDGRQHLGAAAAAAAAESSKSTSGESDSEEIFREASDRWVMLIRGYAQPSKIALAASIMTLLAVVDQLVLTTKYDSLWGVIVICVVRHESVSSSFLVGYQRLEGTAIGSLYAFVTYQLLNCGNGTCGLSVKLPVLLIWLAICAAFREGPRHGYAAQTAGMTPLILFLGASSDNGPWSRIFETVIGVALYLVIDNVILPSRSDSTVRQGVLQCTEETRTVVSEAVGALHSLVSVMTEGEAPINLEEMLLQNAEMSSKERRRSRTEAVKSFSVFSASSGKNKKSAAAAADTTGSTGIGIVSSPLAMAVQKKGVTTAAQEQFVFSSTGVIIPVADDGSDCSPSEKTSTMPVAQSPAGVTTATTATNAAAIAARFVTFDLAKNSAQEHRDHQHQQEDQDLQLQLQLLHTPDAANIDSELTNQSTTTRFRAGTTFAAGDLRGAGAVTLEQEDEMIFESRQHTAAEQQQQQQPEPECGDEEGEGDDEESLGLVDAYASSFRLSFPACAKHLAACEAALVRMQGIVSGQQTNLSFVIHEPELWHRPFPVGAYERLFFAFGRVIKSGLAVVLATKSFSQVLRDTMQCQGSEEVDLHLAAYGAMNKELFAVSKKADKALRLAVSSLRRLYAHKELRSNLTPIVTLSRSCDTMLATVEEHFRQMYGGNYNFISGLDAYNVLAFQDVFVSVSGLVKHLGELGIALHTVRDVEALSFM